MGKTIKAFRAGLIKQDPFVLYNPNDLGSEGGFLVHIFGRHHLVEDVGSPRHVQEILLGLDLARIILLRVRDIQVISLVCISSIIMMT